MTHEHEFLIEDESNVAVERDGYYTYVAIQCAHAPILDSMTDYERDETYIVMGDQCEARKHVTYVLDNVEVENAGYGGDTWHPDEEHYGFFTELFDDQIEFDILGEFSDEWAAEFANAAEWNEPVETTFVLDEAAVHMTWEIDDSRQT